MNTNTQTEILAQNNNTAESLPRNGESEDLDKTNALIQVPNTKICYYPLQNIGRGATSSVYLGYFGSTDCKTPAAIKIVKQENNEILLNELQIWKLLLSDKTGSSSNIVKLFDWGQYETSYNNYSNRETMFVLAMELASCNLRQFVTTNYKASIDILKSICFDVAQGLKFLHGNGILHRDVKPENVLVFQSDDNTVAKLGDFGLSSIINYGTTNTTARGTELWMSPEALTKLHKGQKFKQTKFGDIFSLGMTMYFALSKGQHPFSYSESHENFPEMNIKDPTIVPAKLLYNPSYTEMDLLEWMMQKEPQKRPCIQKVLLHPLFWGKQKCLEFICFIARKNNDKSDPKCQDIRQDIESDYQKFHQSIYSEEFEWKSVIDKRLLERKGRGKKLYQGNVIFSLVELIRDKREHHCDMVEDLLLERFSDRGIFSDEKYADYFLNLFPQIIQFFFTYFIKQKATFNHNAIKSTSFENENKIFTNESDQGYDEDSKISKLDFGKLQLESEKELKSVAVQTIESSSELTPQQVENRTHQLNKIDYDQWNEDDYDKWDDYDLLDEYDPADEYDPTDEYDPADEYDPTDEYDPADDHDPADDYNLLDEYDPVDDYNPLEDLSNDYD